MAKAMAKRFYKTVTVAEVDGGWSVQLDGKQLRTPGKLKLSVRSKKLAEKIAGEWDAQTDNINPSVMPITRLVNVAVEQTPDRRDDLVGEALRYARTDLLCFRAPQPRILKDRQSEAWDKWLKWAAKQGVELETTEGLQTIVQPAGSFEKLVKFTEALDDLKLTLFVHLIAVYGSVVLAMAVMQAELSSGAAFDLSRVDYDYQIELWGEDELQADITADLREETVALGHVLDVV